MSIGDARFGSKADICSAIRGGLWPLDLIPALWVKSRHSPHSFDHFVGDREHARRNGDAERFGGREIDDKLKLGRLQHR
jgi:hypothetical protein